LSSGFCIIATESDRSEQIWFTISVIMSTRSLVLAQRWNMEEASVRLDGKVHLGSFPVQPCYTFSERFYESEEKGQACSKDITAFAKRHGEDQVSDKS